MHLHTSGETWFGGQVSLKCKWNALRTLTLKQTSGSGFVTGAHHHNINKWKQESTFPYTRLNFFCRDKSHPFVKLTYTVLQGSSCGRNFSPNTYN